MTGIKENVPLCLSGLPIYGKIVMLLVLTFYCDTKFFSRSSIGSNDEATWTLLFREENGAEWKSTSDERVHLIQDPKPFRHYRLLVTQVSAE